MKWEKVTHFINCQYLNSDKINYLFSPTQIVGIVRPRQKNILTSGNQIDILMNVSFTSFKHTADPIQQKVLTFILFMSAYDQNMHTLKPFKRSITIQSYIATPILFYWPNCF